MPRRTVLDDRTIWVGQRDLGPFRLAREPRFARERWEWWRR